MHTNTIYATFRTVVIVTLPRCQDKRAIRIDQQVTRHVLITIVKA